MPQPLSAPLFRSTLADGTPNASGKVYTYLAGTLTPQATYTTSALTTANANPVVLDASGCAAIWPDPDLTYRVVEKTSADAAITGRDVDNIAGSDFNAQRTKSILEFAGVTGTAGVDQTAGIALALAYCEDNLPMTLDVPAGTYQATDFGNWALTGLTMRCANGARFKLTGNNDTGLLLKAFPNDLSSEPFVQGFSILGELVVEVPSTCIYAVRVYGLARCKIERIRVIGGDSSTGRAFKVNACSINEFGFTCSTDQDTMSSIPYYGVDIDTGTREGVSLGASTNNTFYGLRMEGVAVGVLGTSADNNTFVGGTAESCTEKGLDLSVNARNNTFYGFAMEANTSYDVVDKGVSNSFIGCYGVSAGGLLANEGARACHVRGGLWEKIDFQSDSSQCEAHGVFMGYSHASTSGGFLGDGPGTRWSNLYGGAITASFAGTVMTVSAVSAGVYIEAGQTVNVTGSGGSRVSTTIVSQASGTTGSTGTYNLTATLGTLASRGARMDAPIYPQKARVGVTVTGTASFAWRNTTGDWVEVALASGTLTALTRTRNGVATSLATAMPSVHQVGPGDTLTVEWSGGGGAAPTFRYETMGGL